VRFIALVLAALAIVPIAANADALRLATSEDSSLAVQCYQDVRAYQNHLDFAVSKDGYGLCGYRNVPFRGPGEEPLEAVYRRMGTQWVYARLHTSGAYNPRTLSMFGVPPSIAAALISERDAPLRTKGSY
jgi:hypothetical protein